MDEDKFYFLSTDGKDQNGNASGGDAVYLYEIDYNNSLEPVLEPPISITHFDPPDEATQDDAGQLIDVDCSFIQDVTYRDGYLYSAFSVNHTGIDDIGYSAIRYFQISTSNYTVPVDKDFYIDGYYCYYPAITVNANGEAFMTFNCSGNDLYPSVYYAYMAAR